MVKYDVNQQLNTALQFCQQGKFADALQPLQQVIKQQQNAFAWFLFATALSQLGRSSEAISAYRSAIGLQPVYPEAYNNLGVVYESLNQLQNAEQCYSNALEQKPDYANALYNLGHIKQNQNEFDEAITLYQQAVKENPDYTKAWNNLGLVFLIVKDYQSSGQCFNNAHQLTPKDPEILSNLGQLYFHQDDYENALKHYHQALEINNNIAQIHNNIALAYQQLGDYSLAEKHLQQAIQLDSSFFEAVTNLGNLYKENNQEHNAKNCYEEAIAISPNYPEALVNYGLLLYQKEEYDQALQLFEKAYAAHPESTEAEYNIATNALSSGDFVKGWSHYRARPIEKQPLAAPLDTQQLSELKNKRILLLAEQGIGDELFFLRFVSQLSSHTPSICLAVSDKILPLVSQQPYIEHVYPISDFPKTFDYYVSLGDLPALLVQDNKNIPDSIRLNVSSQSLNEMQQLLKKCGPPPYTALTWRGGQKVKNLLYKQMPIEQLWPAVKKIPGTLISLQRQADESDQQQLARLNQQRNFVDLSEISENLPNLLALLSLLDEYIGVSNTNMHLRAALGKSARVLVQQPAEWRWMFNGNSPWFPEFQVYRQTADKDWSIAVSQLTKDLYTRYGQ